jgi:uncharacterized protein
MSLTLGLSSGALYPGTATEETPEEAARLGIVHVELMLQTASEYRPAFFRDIARRSSAVDVQVWTVHIQQHLHPFLSAYARRASEARTLFRQAIEGANESGARALVWHGVCERDEPVALDRFVELCYELAATCADGGIGLAVENVSWCRLSSARAVADFAAQTAGAESAPRIGFAFDPFQAAEARANPFLMLQSMSGRLLDVHLRDFSEREPERRDLTPGDGDLPWSALLRAVVNAGHDGPLMIEGSLGPQPAATMERVRLRFEPLIEQVLSSSGDCAGEPPAGVLEGIRLFNERKFYECHEEIEHEWHAEPGPIRDLYQGILQIGVGFHHALGGNHRGAVLLLTDGIEKTSRFLPVCLGIDTTRFVAESQACLEQIANLGPESLNRFDRRLIPMVHRATANSAPD